MEIAIATIIAFLAGAAITALVASMLGRRTAFEREKMFNEKLEMKEKAAADALEAQKQAAAEVLEAHRAASAAAIEEQKKTSAAALAAQQERFDETMKNVTAQVKAATEDMLKERQKEFAEASNTSIGQILNPLKENIDQLKKAMDDDSKEQAQRHGEMKESIRNLMTQSESARKSADELAAAFKHGSKIQGDWGETILEELLNGQGLTKGVHYDTQATIVDEKGKTVKTETGSIMRPDVILHLDKKREVIIDSKVSLTAYVNYVSAETEEDRRKFLKAHVDSIKKHYKELAEKDYASYIQAPKVSAGYVIMFVPNYGALWSALKEEPGLWREAANANVYIADEQSLYGALKIVEMTWTQIAQAQNHEMVFELAAEMIDRVGLFVKRYENLGKKLGEAAAAYEDGKKKLVPSGQSIINTAGKLIKLGAKNGDKNPLPPSLLDIDDIPGIDAGTAEEAADADGAVDTEAPVLDNE